MLVLKFLVTTQITILSNTSNALSWSLLHDNRAAIAKSLLKPNSTNLLICVSSATVDSTCVLFLESSIIDISLESSILDISLPLGKSELGTISLRKK